MEKMNQPTASVLLIKYSKKITYRSTDVWNSLPQSVVDAPSFEVKIYKLWKNHPKKIILLPHLYYGLCHL